MSYFVTLWTHQAPSSMGFSRQEYWSGLPFPSPGDLPNPGTKPRSSALQADALTSEPPGYTRIFIHLSNQEYIWSPHWGLLEGTTLKEWLISPVWQEVCWLKKMHNLILENYVLVSGYTGLKPSSSQSYGFPSSMYGCESWTINKAECQRIDAFKSCGVGEDSWESLVLHGDQTSQS